MAATGFTPISLYYSATASAVPLAANLTAGELALNTNDGKLYYKNSGGTVSLLASNAATTNVSSISFGSTGLTPATATTGAVTVAGTLAIANGGTNQTAFTTGQIHYGAFATSANLFYDSANIRLGVGTSSPVDLLQVNRASGSGITSGISLTTTAGAGGDGSYIKWTGNATAEKIARIDGVIEGTDLGSIRFNTGNGADGFAERMRIDSSGNVGIGTSSPSNKLTVSGSGVSIAATGAGETRIFTTNSTASVTAQTGAETSTAYVGSYTNHPFVIRSNDTERMRFDTSGNLMVGTTSVAANAKVTVSFTGGASSSRGLVMLSGSTASTAMIGFQNPNGYPQGEIVTSGTTTAYNTSSDYRLKEDIAPMTGALAKVVALKPVTYKWKVDGSNGEGFIAHELAEVCPYAVTGEKDAVDAEGNPQYQGIDVSFLVATLTAAIQELKAEFDAYKAAHP